MPYLFVFNATRQTQRVYFRTHFEDHTTPESRRGQAPNQHEILAGRQVALGNTEFDADTAQEIIEQLRRYGALGHEEVRDSNKRAPLVYNYGRQVPVGACNTMVDMNVGLMAVEGALRRSRAAVIVNELVQTTAAETLRQQGFDSTRAPMKGFAVELEQEDEIGEKGRLEFGAGGGTLDPRGPGAPPPAPPAQPIVRRGPGRPRRVA